MAKILITGAVGQIGTELTAYLRKKHGGDSVVASDRRGQFPQEFLQGGPCEKLDVTDRQSIEQTIEKHGIDTIYHLAGLLSAAGERNPDMSFNVNLLGLKNMLDAAKAKGAGKVFWPSSIAAFGPTTPKQGTPQRTVLEPTTMYGMNKVAGELLCQYYFLKFGLDIRSIRYPGLITYKTEPSDGTTEYSIAMFYEGIQNGRYKCFLRKDTMLPMMYIDDAIRGTVELMDAAPERLTVRTSYNLAALSFTPGELAAEIGRHLPGFECAYEPDFHQPIADSWPKTIDDSQARQDWGWRHKYDLPKMTAEIIRNLKPMLENKGKKK